MSVTTSMYFLARDEVYNDEKPYRLRFVPPPGFPETNINTEKHEISIGDIRTQERKFSLEREGFALLPLKSSMNYDDFFDVAKIEQVYLKEVAELLISSMKASRVQIFEHLVSAQFLGKKRYYADYKGPQKTHQFSL
jgi:hypothetical protein